VSIYDTKWTQVCKQRHGAKLGRLLAITILVVQPRVAVLLYGKQIVA
jgi:hypothetical protein